MDARSHVKKRPFLSGLSGGVNRKALRVGPKLTNMKKILSTLGMLYLSAVIITSCNNGSIEADAKKVAELQCKAQKLMQKATSGDMSVLEESTKLTTEATALGNELEGKYTSDSDKKKFAEALLKEMENCK